MRFTISHNKPYLCSGGRVYPVEIKNGTIRIDKGNGELSEEKGRYSLQEIISKLGDNCSSLRKRKRKSQEV